MPTLRALRRMLSSDIKPLKAGLQEKTQSSLILCVTWHLFGAAFLLHRVWGGIQIEGVGRGGGGAGRAAPVKMALRGRSIGCHTRRRAIRARLPRPSDAKRIRTCEKTERIKKNKKNKSARRAAARPAAAFGYNVPQSRGFNARL